MGFVTTGALISFAVLLTTFGTKSIFNPLLDEKVAEYLIAHVYEMMPASLSEDFALIFGIIEIHIDDLTAVIT